MKITNMRYSIEPRDRIYVKGCGFVSFAKNIDKNLSNKYGQKLIDSEKKSTMDATKTASKRTIQKTAETTDDLIVNKIADKITSVLTKKTAKNDDANNEIDADVNVPKKKIHISRRKATNYWWLKVRTKKGCIFLEIIDELRLTSKERYISLEERQQIIDELRLV